ncbi:MAG: flagellar biosynthetic protein FliO [Thioalkalivibrio sp.]|nr:MAG: flagellar biosynthetic protein FliO [Thioalkalivibrio sp.]
MRGLATGPLSAVALRRGGAAAAVIAGLAPGALAAGTAGGAWPVPAGAGMDAAYLAQLLVGLILVIAAILVLAFLMRRVGGIQSRLGSEFRVLGGISLGSRERMVLVQVGERQLLVGVAPGRVQTLHVLEEPIRVEGRGAQDGTARSDSPFAHRLRAALNREPTA